VGDEDNGIPDSISADELALWRAYVDAGNEPRNFSRGKNVILSPSQTKALQDDGVEVDQDQLALHERALVGDLIAEAGSHLHFASELVTSVRSAQRGEDPPDCIVRLVDGTEHGIEVTGFENPEVNAHNAKAKPLYIDTETGEVLLKDNKVNWWPALEDAKALCLEIVSKKSRKMSKRIGQKGPISAASLSLLIFDDNSTMSKADVQHVFGEFNQDMITPFNFIYWLGPYQPEGSNEGKYPVARFPS